MSRLLAISATTLAQAADALASGQLVAFPTETVYGLGGSACQDLAVAAIFAAKGRPDFNPLIVHFPSVEAVRSWVEMDERAEAVAAAFWPGPLTLVLPRRQREDGAALSALVSAGLPTVAVRVPAHPAARRLLELAGVPVAAPSANRSGGISPSTAAHVEASLGEKVGLILDGGPCEVGVESTVLDLSTPQATLLRPGGITPEQIRQVIGPLALSFGGDADPAAPKSPGQLLSHYAPRLPVRLNVTSPQPGEAWLGFGPQHGLDQGATLTLSACGDTTEAAANLFAALHRLDLPERFSAIAVAPVPAEGLGLAINDRLRRAAAAREAK